MSSRALVTFTFASVGSRYFRISREPLLQVEFYPSLFRARPITSTVTKSQVTVTFWPLKRLRFEKDRSRFRARFSRRSSRKQHRLPSRCL